MNTVEKVAKAIARSYIAADHQDDAVDRLVEEQWTEWVAEARAALTALREPSEGMVEAMHRAYERHGQSGGLRASRLSDDQLRATYQAAIDYALSEKDPDQ
jgi:hypothetical protein